MKAATVYRKDELLYLHSLAKTTAGIWIATEPFLRIGWNDAAVAKGEAALTVLNACSGGMAHPTNWDDLGFPLLKLAGVASWASFVRGAASVDLEQDEGRLKLIPCRNRGAKDGFEQIPAKSIELPCPSLPDQVGAALEEALASCG